MRLFRLAMFALPILILAMTGCETGSKPVRTVKAFVPPPPMATPPEPVAEAPSIDVHFFAKQVPMLAAATATQQDLVEVEMRISRANEMFRTGSAMLAKGETAAARKGFDEALDYLLTAPPKLIGREHVVRRYEQMVDEIYRLELETASASGQPVAEPAYERSPLQEVARQTFPVEPALKGKVKEQLQWTVSKLPLDVADPVLAFLNYFSSPAGIDVIKAGTRRGGKYSAMIRRILDEEGLPPELYYMAQAESAFLPRAVSWAQAVGMWQFVQFRGREYGLMQTPYTDDRMDPEKATRAAARHLKDLYTQFGDWYLAIAAYNCGPVAVDRAVERTGYADFWELYNRNVLPRETANYLPIILAMTIMAKNPKDYGLEDVSPDPPLEYDTIKMDAATHLNLIADILDKPLPLIRDLNPSVLWLMAPAAYPVHVPKGTANRVLAALESVPAERRATWRLHRFNAGDNMASIARQYRLPERSVSDANPAASDPQPGDLLLVPSSYPGGEPPSLARRSGRLRTPVIARKPVAARPPARSVAANGRSRR
ncbi:MAG: transglycosylase SLT domain-containing protein [Bryobacteraceae bacterium]